MQKHLVGACAAFTLVLGACGGGSGGDQGEVAKLIEELAQETGLELDEECVEKAAAKLSDSDAEAILAAGADGEPDISEEGSAIGDEMFSCVDVDSYLETVIAGITADGSVDADCLREQLGDVKTAAEVDEKVMDAAFACSS